RAHRAAVRGPRLDRPVSGASPAVERTEPHRTLFVDVLGGAAGDMLLAALVDAGASESRIRAAVEAGIPGRFRFSFGDASRGKVRALLLRVEDRANAPAAPAASARESRPFAELLLELDAAPLDEPVRARARSVIERLGDEESRVHGVGPDELR